MSESPNNNDNKGSVEEEKSDKCRQLVNNIFGKMNDNNVIPDSLKPIIEKLKVPFLDIANATPNLFAFDSHYARVFLDNVCRVSIDWKDIEDRQNSYIKRLESIVDKICNMEKYINKDFVKYQNDLEKTLVKLKKRAEIKKKRENEKLLGQKKINEAKKETARIIEQKINDSTVVSDYIKNILNEEWTNVLVILHIRNGQDSKDYQSKVEFVNLLLELSSNPASPSEAKEQFKLLFKKYQKGLEMVAFNNQEIKEKKLKLLEFFTHINKTTKTQKDQENNKPDESIDPQEIIKMSQHQKGTKEISETTDTLAENQEVKSDNQKQIIEQHETKEPKKTINKDSRDLNDESNEEVAKHEFQKTLKYTDESNQSPLMGKESEENLETIKVVESFKAGNWFEIQTANGQFIKAKLSWVSPITGKHLFVDSQGLKISDKTKPQLIEGLKTKTIKIIKGFE